MTHLKFDSTKQNKKLAEETLDEALSLLHLRQNDVDCTIELVIDGSLNPGSARVKQKGSHHLIQMNPVKIKSFPWQTVRHEMLHALMKESVGALPITEAFDLPVGCDYAKQSLRDNIEEYFVRALNVLPMKDENGTVWYRKQITREKQSGFLLMSVAANFVRRFRVIKKCFDLKTFHDFTNVLFIANMKQSYKE